jgi:hypothetical protein
MAQRSLASALSALLAYEVDFIVVGGVAAVLHGAPVQTFDLDLVYLVEPLNIDRLLNFLEEGDAFFRIQPERRLRPGRTHLAAGGHLNLLTIYGPLDLLGTIGRNLDYRDLVVHSPEMEIAEGVRVRVLDLETIIAVKEQLDTDKDRAILPVLRATLRLKNSGP